MERGHGVGVARAAKAAKVAVDKSCQVGEHVLDNFSNYLFHQIQRPFAKYIPDDWDPLDFLPVNIQSSLQKSEALVSPLASIHPSQTWKLKSFATNKLKLQFWYISACQYVEYLFHPPFLQGAM